MKSVVPNLSVAYFAPNDTSQDPLNISHENISIHPKASADAAVAHWDGGLVALPLSDYDAYCIPVAIYRKDNPKKALHEFFERTGNAWE